jgi:Flp pilus assembly pilin Flp
MRFKDKRGQSATEYMLIIAVVVLGIVAAASNFIPTFKNAVMGLADNVAGWLTTDQEMANP